MTCPRPPGSLAEATQICLDEAGREVAARLIGRTIAQVYRYANPHERSCIPMDLAVVLDRFMMQFGKTPEQRRPVHLLAMAEAEGLSLTWVPQDTPGGRETPETLALTLHELHGRLSRMVRDGLETGFTTAEVEQARRMREEIAAGLNELISSMERRGVGENVARLRVGPVPPLAEEG